MEEENKDSSNTTGDSRMTHCLNPKITPKQTKIYTFACAF